MLICSSRYFNSILLSSSITIYCTCSSLSAQLSLDAILCHQSQKGIPHSTKVWYLFSAANLLKFELWEKGHRRHIHMLWTKQKTATELTVDRCNPTDADGACILTAHYIKIEQPWAFSRPHQPSVDDLKSSKLDPAAAAAISVRERHWLSYYTWSSPSASYSWLIISVYSTQQISLLVRSRNHRLMWGRVFLSTGQISSSALRVVTEMNCSCQLD